MKSIFIITLPVAVAYIVIGVAFGILAANYGLDFWQILLSAVFVFSASLQFLLLSLIKIDASLWQISIACLLINLRHFFYVLGALDYFRAKNWAKFYALFALTDESFAILSAKKYEQKTAFLIIFINHIYWIIGCLLGFFISHKLSHDYSSLSFSLNALFITLAYELYSKNKSNFTLFLGLILGLFGLALIDKNYMLFVCITLGIFILLLRHKKCIIG